MLKKAVVFVEVGMTPEEVMRAAKSGKFNNLENKYILLLKTIGSIIGFIGFLYLGYWLWIMPDPPPPTPTITAIAQKRSTVTPTIPETTIPTPPPTLTATVIIAIITPTPTTTPTTMPSPTLTPTSLPLAIATLKPLTDSLFISPISISPIATPTPNTDYILVHSSITPTDLYPYVSGWLFEKDNQTPRPDKIEICHPTACMKYPRPNNTDIANGYYEFLVEPGHYQLKLNDLIIPIEVLTIPHRYEFNFKYTKEKLLKTAVRSNPWQSYANSGNSHQPPATKTPTPSPTPTPTPTQTPPPTPTLLSFYIAFVLFNQNIPPKQSNLTPTPAIEPTPSATPTIVVFSSPISPISPIATPTTIYFLPLIIKDRG